MRHTCGHSRYMNNNIDDETLMLRFQQSGDLQAFERLFRRHKDAFVTFLARLSGNLPLTPPAPITGCIGPCVCTAAIRGAYGVWQADMPPNQRVNPRFARFPKKKGGRSPPFQFRHSGSVVYRPVFFACGLSVVRGERTRPW